MLFTYTHSNALRISGKLCTYHSPQCSFAFLTLHGRNEVDVAQFSLHSCSRWEHVLLQGKTTKKTWERGAHARRAGYLNIVNIDQSWAFFSFASTDITMKHVITNPFRKINAHGVQLLDVEKLRNFCIGMNASLLAFECASDFYQLLRTFEGEFW